MARRSTLRASDADREQFAERLRHATAEGRLLAEELEDRLGAVFRARTYGELDAVVADLPRAGVAERPRSRALARARSLPPAALILAIPIAAAVVVATLIVVATLFAFWWLVLLIGWIAFGHRRAYYGPVRYRRSMHACGRWRA